MKKVLLILVSFFIITTMSACTTNNINLKPSNQSEEKITLNKTVVANEVYYSLIDIQYSDGKDFDIPNEGNQFVIVTIKIENKSKDTISYNVYDWAIINDKGEEKKEVFNIIDADTNLGSGKLSSGEIKTGTIVFEVSKNDISETLVVYNSSILDKTRLAEFKIK